MSQKRTKIHHYVPKTLQRRFCAEGERIWYTERGPSGRFSAPEMRNIASTFKMRNYYTVIESGRPSDKVETEFFGKLDDYFGEILVQLGQIFESGKVPEVTGVSFRH